VDQLAVAANDGRPPSLSCRADSADSLPREAPVRDDGPDVGGSAPGNSEGASRATSTLSQRARLAVPFALPPAEAVTKWTAVGVLLIYGFGYLILSLYYASFVFFDLSPFKPRVIAAGTWFFIFASTVVLTALKLWPERSSIAEHLVDLLWSFWIFYYAADFIGGKIFDYAEPSIGFGRHEWSGSTLYLPVALFAMVVITISRWSMKKNQAVSVGTASLGLLVMAGYALISARPGFTFPLLAFELCFLAYVSRFYLDAVLKKPDNELNWIWMVAFLLSGIAGFGTTVYPHIKSSWGGGSPVPVTVYLSKESRVLPGGEFCGYLLEESDVGIFVTRHQNEHALFLPRSAVASVFYSDKPLPPEYFGSGNVPMPPQ
jgi:hypothetical protein